MIDTLALMTGIDVPIPELQVVLHQPTCKEIAMAGRESYLLGAQCLCLDKSNFSQDESLLRNTTNFQIFMTIMTEKDPEAQKRRDDVLNALTLLFPSCSPKILPRNLGLFDKENKQMKMIDENNFELLQAYIKDIICVSKDEKNNYNPGDARAKAIAEKLKRGRQRIAAEKAAENAGGDIFTQYLSVVVIGIPSMSLKDAMELTMFQLYDLVERYSLYTSWDLDVRARMAGAKAEKDLENWMKNIH